MKEKVSGRQATFLALGTLMGTVFLPLTQASACSSGRDGWMTIFPGYLLAFPFVYLVLYVLKKYPNQNLLETAKQTLSPWLGYPLAIVYVLVCAWFGGLLLRQGAELFARSLMPETPLWVFVLGEWILVVLMTAAGMEVFARFNELIVIPVFLSLILLIIFSIPKAEIDYLKPILYNGWHPLLTGALGIVPFGFEFILFLWILLPVLNKPQELIRSSLKGYVGVSTVLTGLTMTAFTVFSPEEATRLVYGALSLARIAEIGKVFRGIEAFFIVIWFGASLIKITMFSLCTFYAAQTIIPIKRRLLSVSLVGLILVVIALYPENGAQWLQMIMAADKYLILPLGSLGTFLLAAAAFFRRR